MKYDLYDLGERPKGTVIELTLSAQANIRLIDKMNLDLYTHGSDYRCATKHVETSPYRLQVPEDRHWFLMIEQNGKLKHSAMIYPPKKAPAGQPEPPKEN